MNSELHGTWRSKNGKYTVSISTRVFENMVQLARRHAPNEIGTSLVGSYSGDGHVALVTQLAPVTADSRSGRFSFHRGVAGLRRFFRQVFSASQGRTYYVGEWHSHVGGAPVPSLTDEENMMEIAGAPKEQCPECILIILGLNGEAVDLGVYVFSRVRGRIDLPQVPNTAVCTTS